MATCFGFSGGVCVTSSGTVGTCCGPAFGAPCTDISSDSTNCGGCGISCEGGTCTDGACSTTLPPCEKGHNGQFCNLDAGLQFVCCAGEGCVDTSSDSMSCGRCGLPCKQGLSCISGSCVVTSCSSSLQYQTCVADAGTLGECCGAGCVDLERDPMNCGRCGATCVGSETCVSSGCGLDLCDVGSVGSTCHFDAGSSVIGGVCCAAGCVDTAHDVNNCGGCNRHCPSDAGCQSGSCI
jgi:hypothetical protein